jgi:hypothetical protein
MLRKAGPAVLVALLAILALASPAAAVEPIGGASTFTTSKTTYRADPAKGLINVSITLKVTNQTPDSYDPYVCTEYVYDPYYGPIPYTSTCTRTTRYYLTETSVVLESTASGVKATSSAGKVTARREASTAGPPSAFTGWTLTFPKIFNGQTRTITLTYTIHAGAARSGSSVRLNGAYLSFGAFAQPADESSVRIVVPSGFSTETAGGQVVASTSGGSKVFDSGPVRDPSQYYVLVTGTNPAGFHRESIDTVEGRRIDLESWPGDTDWLGAVRTEASSSIGQLEQLIGRPFPGMEAITIREVAAGALGDAYAGVYDPDEHLARIPESYEQAGTVAHELSHAWFNGALFAPQWLSEGYAGWAERAVGANPEACTTPKLGIGRDPIALDEWKVASPRATQAEFDAVDAEYTASCGIISEVADKIGPDGMRAVLGVLSTADGAYPGTRDASIGAPNDWRAWLDAVDEQGIDAAATHPFTDVADLLVRYGAASAGDLAGRADARDALDQLRRSTGKLWTIPLAVYQPMSTWDFTTADRAIGQMQAVMDDSAQVRQVLAIPAADGPLPARVASSTSLSDLASAREAADAQLAAAQDVSAAFDRLDADQGPIASLGLLGVDFQPLTHAAIADVATLDLDAARANVAAMDATLQGATSAGLLRIGIGMGVVALVFAAVFWLLRRRRRPAPALALPDPAAAAIIGAPALELTSLTPELRPADPSPGNSV